MRHVDPPRVPNLARHRLGATDPLVAAWRHRVFAGQAHDDPRTLGATEDQLLFALIEVERRRAGRQDSAYERKLARAMAQLTPVLSHPRMHGSDFIPDLELVLAQPEMLDFWPRWLSPRLNSTPGPAPTAEVTSKALLTTLGMLGRTTHADDALADLCNMPALQKVFAGVELASARLAGLPDPDPFTVASYSGTMARVKSLTRAHTVRPLQLRAKAKMLGALRELLPDAHIGEGFYIDGRLFPAWQVQVGGGGRDGALNKALQAAMPWVGSRVLAYNSKRKRDIEPGEKVSRRDIEGSVFYARGAFEVTVIEAATGWPLVSVIWPGYWDEALALVPLLEDLFRYFRGVIDAKWLAADGAWDEEWAHRLCEVEYGLALIARDTGRFRGNREEPAEPDIITLPHGGVSGYSSDTGQLLEAERGQPLALEGFTRPPFEDGCYPGHPVKGERGTTEYAVNLARREAGFNVRAVDRSTGQRYSVKAKSDWRRLCAYPRYAEGNEKKFAERQAAQMRLRNLVEGHNSRIAVGFKMLNKGADRMRYRDREKLEALVGLAELRICALSLADVRQTLGQPVAQLPNAPVAAPTPRRPQPPATPTPPPAPGRQPNAQATSAKLGVRPGAATLVTGVRTSRAQPAPAAPPVPVTAPSSHAKNVIAVDFEARRRKP